eukprot:Hpha_TRINITY_DN30088_c0_g1::TRINITY_DN30088_c0_g1_i1::g.21615::m.21615
MSRLHENATAAARSRRGENTGGGGRPSGVPDMSPAADAIFQHVLDGILTTSLVKYTPPAPIRALPKRDRIWGEDKGRRSGWTMTGRPSGPVIDDSPGPGHYSSSAGGPTKRAAKPRLTESKRRRPSPPSPPLRGTPGPGSYDVAKSATAFRLRSPSPVTMRPPPRAKPAPAATPGPGQYEARKAAPVAPCRPVIGTAPRQERVKAAAPGPGEYDPKPPSEAARVPCWKSEGKGAKRKRTKPPVAPLPGPGQYEVQSIKSPRATKAFSWGSAPTGRQTAGEKEAHALTPGPGSYDLAVASGDEGG